MRGFLSGVIWGVVVVGVGLVAMSLSAPVAPRPDVSTTAPEPSEPGATDMTDSGVDTAAQDSVIVEVAPTAPSDGTTEPDSQTSIEAAETDLPEAPGVNEALNVPNVAETPSETTDTALGTGETDATDTPQAAEAPVAPENGTSQGIDQSSVEQDATDPANVPDVATTAPQAQAPSAAKDGAGVQVGEVAPVDSPSTAVAPTAPVGEDSAPEPDQTSPRPNAEEAASNDIALAARDTDDQTQPSVSRDTDAAPRSGAPLQLEDAPADDPAPEVSTTPAEEPAPDAVAESAPESTPAPIDTPAPEVAEATTPETSEAPTDQSREQRESALPVITAPETEEAPDSEETPEIAALPEDETGEAAPISPSIGTRVVPLTERDSAVVSEGGVPPLESFAAEFDNPEEKPLMAIILIDDADAIGVEALKDFPYPLTFAVNPLAPDAADKMARHRAAGFEVVAVFDLLPTATAQDAEVNLSVGFDLLNEAIAVIEGIGTGIQGNRALSDQVTAFVASTGRGLITQGNGLNTVQKLAVREGVPAVPVFRDFDGAGQTPTVMRRFLDQAAFRAGQEGGVVMLGRVRPDTVSALILWGLQDRASRVALAPVSAVLQQSVARQ